MAGIVRLRRRGVEGGAPSLVAELAKQARATDVAELKRFTQAKRYALLLSLIHNAKARSSERDRPNVGSSYGDNAQARQG